MNLQDYTKLVHSRAEDLQNIFHRWQKASMDTARERNMRAMIAIAVELRELSTHHSANVLLDTRFQGHNLLSRLQGEMNLYNIIETVVMHGLYDNEVFRAECRNYLWDKNRKEEKVDG